MSLCICITRVQELLQRNRSVHSLSWAAPSPLPQGWGGLSRVRQHRQPLLLIPVHSRTHTAEFWKQESFSFQMVFLNYTKMPCHISFLIWRIRNENIPIPFPSFLNYSPISPPDFKYFKCRHKFLPLASTFTAAVYVVTGQQHPHRDKLVILQKNPKVSCLEIIKTAYGKYHSYKYKYTQHRQKWEIFLKNRGKQDTDSNCENCSMPFEIKGTPVINFS